MKDLSLYIHIPFCKSRCLYCGFTTYAGKDCLINKYVRTLLSEIKRKSPSFKNYEIASIYFGGGTPSYIPPHSIEKILHTVRTNFTVNRDAEITMESNPESIDERKIIFYKKTGINRLSIGIQSLNDKTLKKIGRAHNAQTAIKAIKTARKHFKNFSLDFIMGLPCQNEENFSEQLEKILKFNPPHLSFYFLSRDTKAIDTFIKDCPDEEVQIKIYKNTVKKLKQAGIKQYEVSNYAKPGFECRHNIRYWEQREYLGLGLAAHSFYNNTVYENQKSLETYLQAPAVPFESLKLDTELQKMDYIMMRLRTARGIDKEDFAAKFGSFEPLVKKSQDYIASGTLIDTNSRLRASEKGFLVLDRIINDLI